jgi:hypothetical protein
LIVVPIWKFAEHKNLLQASSILDETLMRLETHQFVLPISSFSDEVKNMMR